MCFKRLKKRGSIDDKRVSAHQCRRYMATTQLTMGRSPLDVQRQMGHTTLQMTNKYASLTIGHLRKLHERQGIHLCGLILAVGAGYWDE